MQIIPRTIVARVVALVAVLGLLSFVMHVLIVGQLVRPLLDDMTSAVAGQAVLIKSLVATSHPALTVSELQKNLPKHAKLSIRETATLEKQEVIPFVAGSVVSNMKQKLPPDIRFSAPESTSNDFQKQIHFDFDHRGQTWRITYELFPPVLVLFGSIAGWLLLTALAVSISLYAGVRLVTRPMSEVSAQILANGKQMKKLSISQHAATEVRTMTTAFNQMVVDSQKANERKLQMLAGLSHDLRTPLTRLRFRAELVQDPHAMEAFLQDISVMQNMINQFMAYVHGQTESSLGRPTDVTQQIHKVLIEFAEVNDAPSYRVEGVKTELPDLAFQRLLHNLLDNAVAHGGGKVMVSLALKSSAPKPEAVMTVFDGGRGMTPSEFQRAMQPFVRLQEDIGAGHCGLGLAIVGHIAEQLDGSIGIENHPEFGFGISFTWPISGSI